MKSKRCFKCGLDKPLSSFYKHKKMQDGTVNKCKDCNKKDVSDNYKKKALNPVYIEKERTRGRIKYHKLYAGTGKSNPKANSKWISNFPEKRMAQNVSQRMKKPFPDSEKHHWSYLKEFYTDVIWLTKKQHMKAHRFLVYDQEQMMYRRYDTNELLDTKDSHTLFIHWCLQNKKD